jgi:hypothetical protein
VGIYCPEVGFCGLTEEQAKEQGYEVETSVHRWMGTGALIIGRPMHAEDRLREGRPDPRRRPWPWATELMAEAYLSVNREATPNDLGP